MKPGLLIVKSRVKIDPTWENHIGYIDFSFANRQHKKFESVYLKFFGSSIPAIATLSRSMTQSRTKLTNSISMSLVDYDGHDVGGFLENLAEVFNVVEG
tara:strand:+ start:282 stop:578 length:297 start_codon:yes stop_codon:yes gene_type:complete